MKPRAPSCIFLILFVALFLHTGLGFGHGPSAESLPRAQTATAGSATEVPPSLEPPIPSKAQAVLKAIQDRDGDPPPGYVGGRPFHNRERRLPRGRYREYDVNPMRPGRSRGAERIVIDQQSGKAYYTDDHYRTFVPMN